MNDSPDPAEEAPGYELIDYRAECVKERRLADTLIRASRAILESSDGQAIPNRELVAHGLYLLERDGPGWLESYYGRLAAEQEAKTRGIIRANVREAFGEYIGPQQWATELTDYRGMGAYTWAGDRRGGVMWPIFRTEMELAMIRGQARLVVETVPYARGALDSLTDYAIGTGFTYTAAAIKGRQAPPGLVEAVQRVIDDFLEANDFGSLERELFQRRHRDGERFLRFFHTGAGECQVRTAEPEQVTESGHEPWHTEGDVPGISWMFGIHNRGNDVQSVLGYNVIWDTLEDCEYVPADEMQHCKANVDRSVKRGLTDFYCISDTLDGARKLLRNTREGAAIQAAIAFIKQYPAGTSQSTVQAANAARTDFTVNRPSNVDSLRSVPLQKYDPGTILSIPKGLEYLAGPMGSSNAPNYMLVLQGSLRAAGVRWQMPEGMISGDSSNNNYASALVAEGPFAKRVKAMQSAESSDNRAVIRKVVRIAADEGWFSRWGVGFEQLMQIVEIQVVTPSVEARDSDKETNRRAVLNQAGILSKETWAQQEELDPDVERENIRREAQPAAESPPAAPSSAERTSLAAIEGALECCESVPEARELIRDVLHRRYP